MIITFLISSIIALFLTNFSINFFQQQNVKQYILKDAPESHLIKQGTPTMGGIIIIILSRAEKTCIKERAVMS